MMNLIFALLLALSGSINNIDNHTLTNQDTTDTTDKITKSFGHSYIDTYWPIADSLGAAYGIPAEVILSVAVIESGYGSSRNSKLLNNHFGIVGKNNLKKSHGIKSAYKQYTDVEDSYADFCGLVSRKKFYPNMKGNDNATAWVTAISKAGYSTQPTAWRGKVNSALKKYFL